MLNLHSVCCLALVKSLIEARAQEHLCTSYSDNPNAVLELQETILQSERAAHAAHMRARAIDAELEQACPTPVHSSIDGLFVHVVSAGE